MQSEKNSTACTSHNLQTVGPNVSILRMAWKLRGGAAMCHGRGRERERKKRHGQARKKDGVGGGGAERKHVIFYMTA